MGRRLFCIRGLNAAADAATTATTTPSKPAGPSMLTAAFSSRPLLPVLSAGRGGARNIGGPCVSEVDSKRVVGNVGRWIDGVVVEHHLCPYARTGELEIATCALKDNPTALREAGLEGVTWSAVGEKVGSDE